MRILCFEGGGIRGIFSARIADRLPDVFAKSDLVAGTSTGAINSIGLQYFSPSEVVKLFADNGSRIFEDLGLVDDVEDLWNLEGAQYYNKNLKALMARKFGDRMTSDLPKKTLITAFNCRHPSGRWQPEVMGNLPGPLYKDQVSLVDAIMRSTAAPTVFPVYQKRIDGGVWANHPGMAALSAAINPMVFNAKFQNVSLLSIGTGRCPKQLSTAKNDLGAFDWLKSGIIDVLLDGSMEATDFYLQSILGPRYHRVQLDLPKEIKLDDSSATGDLIALADSFNLADTKAWLQGFW